MDVIGVGKIQDILTAKELQRVTSPSSVHGMETDH